MKAPYRCPKCGRLPHWNAVRLAEAALPRVWPFHVDIPDLREDQRRAALLDLSAYICRNDPAQQ